MVQKLGWYKDKEALGGDAAYHDIPRLRRCNGASHLEDHATQQPEEASNAVLALVVGRDRNVNMAHGRVSVTECDHRNVSKCCFPNWLQQTPNQHISKYSPCVHTLLNGCAVPT